jgi:hypothetical protein
VTFGRSVVAETPTTRWSAAILLGFAVVLAVVAQSFGGVPSRPPSGGVTARVDGPTTAGQLCRVAVMEVAALWDPSATGAAGYGRVASFGEAPSLYYTSWSLQLARRLGLGLGPVDRPQVVSWLQATLRSPGAGTGVDGLPQMTSILLATDALVALDAAVPRATLGRDLAALDGGDDYRLAPGQPPSAAGSYLAAQAAALGGVSPDPRVLVRARQELPRALIVASPQAILVTGIPRLGTVAMGGTLPPGISSSSLAATLRRWRRTLLGSGSSAPALTALASLTSIARDLHLPFAPPPHSFLAPLQLRSGYLSLGPHGSEGDPQVTLDAVSAGGTLPRAAVASTLGVGRLPQGWVTPPTAVSVSATDRAVLIDRSCGVVPHAAALRGLVRRWLAGECAVARSDPEAASAAVLPRVWELASLAATLHVPSPLPRCPALQAALQSNVDPPPRSSAGIVSSAIALQALRLLGRAPRGPIAARLASAVNHLDPATAPQAAALAVLAAALERGGSGALGEGEKVVTVHVVNFLTACARVDGFSFDPRVPVSDLLSSETGAAVFGYPPARDLALADAYETPDGPSLTVAPARAGATVDLTSLLAGVQLSTGDPTPVLAP